MFVSVPVSAIPPSAPAVQQVPDISSKLETFWLDQMASVQNIPDVRKLSGGVIQHVLVHISHSTMT